MKKSHNGLFLGFGLLTALIATVLVTTGGVFSKGFLIRATSTTVENGTITFNGANTTRSSWTYTTPSKTAAGNYIKAVGTDNGLNADGVVTYFSNKDSALHFRDSNNNEFNFSSSLLKQISLTKVQSGTFSIKYAYKQTGDLDYTYSDAISMDMTGEHNINLGNLNDVSEFVIINATNSEGKFSKVVITYDCGSSLNRTLTNLSITTAPTKTEYDDGEFFDKTGMVITATYSDGSTKNVTNSCTFDKTTLEESDTSVTATYTYKGSSMSVVQEIEVTKGEDPTPILSGTYAGTYSSIEFTDISNGIYHYGSEKLYFTYTISGTSITFTYKSGDNTNFGSYRLFAGGSSPKANSTGTIDSASQIKVKTYNMFDTATNRTFTKS